MQFKHMCVEHGYPRELCPVHRDSRSLVPPSILAALPEEPRSPVLDALVSQHPAHWYDRDESREPVAYEVAASPDGIRGLL